MTNHRPFLDAIFARPADPGPALVYSDWLEECGDPRAELLRLWTRDMPPILQGLDGRGNGSWRGRYEDVKKLRGPRLLRLFLAAQALYTPLVNGRRLSVRITDPRSQRAVLAGALYTFDLIGDDERRLLQDQAWAAWREKYDAGRKKHGANWTYYRWRRWSSAAAAAAAAVVAAANVAVAADADVVDEAAAARKCAIRWQTSLAAWLMSRQPIAARLRAVLKQLDAVELWGPYPGNKIPRPQ